MNDKSIGEQLIESLAEFDSTIRAGLLLPTFAWCRSCGARKQVKANLPDCCNVAMTTEPPVKDCANCLYSQEGWKETGHCYMFKTEPEGMVCGQFRPVQKESK